MNERLINSVLVRSRSELPRLVAAGEVTNQTHRICVRLEFLPGNHAKTLKLSVGSSLLDRTMWVLGEGGEKRFAVIGFLALGVMCVHVC